MKNRSSYEISPQVKRNWREACKVRKNSHSPYSGFKVGAAFSHKSKVVTGTNVENASYGAAICAERAAICTAISEFGKLDMQDLVIVTDAKNPTPPCGMCLQVMSEFAPRHMRIWLGNSKRILVKTHLSALLTTPFKSENMGTKKSR